MKQSVESAFPQVLAGNCLESTTQPQFELFDSQVPPQRCYIKHSDEQEGHFSVTNDSQKTIHFLAIDKCVFGDDAETHCDCALFDENVFCFIEIKDAGKRTRKEHRRKAYQQLKSTILVFRFREVFREETQVEAIISFVSKSSYPVRTSSSADAALMFELECNAQLMEGNQKEF
ncbi:hypothetical protein FHS57_004964 [Runella defluvii]|uniref:Uncharacterized protein n=1 Tax=Runella defluvii TaxID=370973 RepID=A0A7W6ESR6_9BACT|nr:hypothetical protein [Runella defluvii]MBB3840943.1 hypothetical protein [Runella defluvii]